MSTTRLHFGKAQLGHSSSLAATSRYLAHITPAELGKTMQARTWSLVAMLRPGGSGRRRALTPLTRHLCLFFLLNSVVLNVLLAVLPWTPERKTALNYSARFLIGRARTDSWGQLGVALDQFRSSPDRPLYSEVFLHRHIRFPYAPPSLLLTAALRAVRLWTPGFLNLVSWVAVWATIGVTILLFWRSMAEHVGRDAQPGGVTATVVGALTLTFYPIVKGFTLGQIQTWINLLLALGLLSWMAGRPARAGALVALPCLVKPQYGILLLWGLSRRRWAFSAAFAGTVGGALALSVGMLGFADHRDYLWMLAYVSRHGESFFANQSVNGLLQRLLHNGPNLDWSEDTYPPFNPWVYGGTLMSSAGLILCALFWRRNEHRGASSVDLMLGMLTCVMASPVAWDHHYGILLPFYGVMLPALLRRPVFGKMTLPLIGMCYVMTSTYFGIAQHTASSAWNVLQSYVFLGGVLVLVLLYRLRSAQAAAGAAGGSPSPPCGC